MKKLIKLITGAVLGVALTFSTMVNVDAQTTLPYLFRSNYHITTNTTNTISGTLYLRSLVINCSVAGASSNTLTVKTKEGTPKIIFQATNIAVGTTTIALTREGEILCTSGIDIVTATGTAPTADVFVVYAKQ